MMFKLNESTNERGKGETREENDKQLKQFYRNLAQ